MVAALKMLLADDSVTIQKVIDLTFGSEGVEVTAVNNGDQAISQLEEVAPDIVLADVFMPGKTGYEVCEYIKKDERTRHIPVMLLVGSFEPFDEAEARRVGADAVMTKPFQSIRELINKVNVLLGGGSRVQTLDLDSAESAKTQNGAERQEQSDEGRLAASHSEVDDQMIEVAPAEEFSTVSDSRDFQDRMPVAARTEDADMHGVDVQSGAPFVAKPVRQVIHKPEAAPVAAAQVADSALLDLGDFEPLPAAAEADDFVLDLEDEPFRSDDEASFERGWDFSAQKQEPEVAEQPPQEMISTLRPGAVSFEESAAAETERLSAPEASISAAEMPTQPLLPAPQTPSDFSASPAIAQYPPELIEAIAQRVVELLSEKVIEEIAWEVVPQLAEVMIKKKLEEQPEHK